jgi:hypothetical protein
LAKILVCGDCGKDHLLVPRKNSLLTGEKSHLFLKRPERNNIEYTKHIAGAELLQALLEEIVGGAGHVVQGEPFDYRWETFSQWTLKKRKSWTSDNQYDAENYGAFFNRHYGRSQHKADAETEPQESAGQISIANSDIVAVYSTTDEDHFAKLVPDAFEGQIVLRKHIVCSSDSKDDNPSKVTAEAKSSEKQLRSKTILLLNIEEMQFAGFFLQKPVSWEQVLEETAKCITQGISGYRDYRAVVVCLKNNGVLLYQKEEDQFILYYLDNEIGELSEKAVERSYGSTVVMQAAITAALAQDADLSHGVVAGLIAARKLGSVGYDITNYTAGAEFEVPLIKDITIAFPYRKIAQIIDHVLLERRGGVDKKAVAGSPRHLFEFRIGRTRVLKRDEFEAQPNFESILKEVLWNLPGEYEQCLKTQTDGNGNKITVSKQVLDETDYIFELCQQIVNYGRIREAAIARNGEIVPCGIPFLRMNRLLTYDRLEIEQICDTYNVLTRYKNDLSRQNPFSICVFGSPGSGKSFTVKEIAKKIIGEEPSFLEFNLSQMSSPEELSVAFHRVRDDGLKGNLPFVFFDEFDTKLGDKSFGWLRYFLAPMQDGEFLEKGETHFLGRAVFIFAGGTCTSMDEFQQRLLGTTGDSASTAETCVEKSLDFLSRVRGYINVSNPNSTRNGVLHFFRRATLLRSVLEGKLKLGHDDYIGIDRNVVKAFLNTRQYIHGSRSLEAIVQMSELHPDNVITRSSIYHHNRLKLHVDGDFQKILENETLD